MLLTITCTGDNADELGYLLHKNPARAQEFELSCGKAYVFYPKAGPQETTAALLLDINPIDLARGKLGSKDGGLFDYVNDRPFVSSSFLSNAISKVFGTALAGRCDKKPELADSPLPLSAELTMLPVSGNKDLLARLFGPLGYSVAFQEFALDEKFADWGMSKYANLRICGTVTLSQLLKHLYVLIPVFDNQKHYYIAREEIDKLLKHGEGWLSSHPERELIMSRYLARKKSFIGEASKRLLEQDESILPEENEAEHADGDNPEDPQKSGLNTRRLYAVAEKVTLSGGGKVIDLGCGEGKLISLLVNKKDVTEITGIDVSLSVLSRAEKRLRLDAMPERKRNKVKLLQGSALYKDERFKGYDVACVVEVIEHLDESRLNAFEYVLFGYASPKTVVLTTPNSGYNINYENLAGGALRHGDHRFEWTKAQFRKWTENISEKYGYRCELSDIGEMDGNGNSPTQMGVFEKCV